MKKSFLLTFFVVSIFSLSVSQATSTNLLSTTKVASTEEPGIVCTIRDAETGGVIGRCYLCNCAKFAEAFFSE